MTAEKCALRVSGMICPQCEDVLSERLLHTRGVLRAEASYRKARVELEYDPALISQADIEAVMAQAGYPAGGGGADGAFADILCLAAVALLYVFIPKVMALVHVPRAETGAALGYLFVVGLLTGFHCIGMCGGILLSQTAVGSLTDPREKRRRGFLASLCYNGGRVVSCTLLGAVFGALGGIIAYAPTFKRVLFIVCGALVVLIGLRMWGLLPGLRRLRLTLPGACALPAGLRRRWAGKPLVVGFLTGFMPCGALAAMWVCAAGSGSAGRGGASMLAFALGTVPLMLLFGALGSLLPPKYGKYMVKAGTVLVTALGLLLMTKGLR